MIQLLQLRAQILRSQFGKRLDQALAELFSKYSRSRIKVWILSNKVFINGQITNIPKKKYLVVKKFLLIQLLKQKMYIGSHRIFH